MLSFLRKRRPQANTNSSKGMGAPAWAKVPLTQTASQTVLLITKYHFFHRTNFQ